MHVLKEEFTITYRKYNVYFLDILKKFNPALEGFSFGEADVDDPGAKNNVAISGNEARYVMDLL